MKSSSSQSVHSSSSSVGQQQQQGAGTLGEVDKLQKHLMLLRSEHLKLQQDHAELQRRYDILKATYDRHGDRELVETDDSDGQSSTNDSFVARLVLIVEELFEKDLYSDITIHLDGHQLRAHRFVLSARSHDWGVPDLSAVDRLEFTNVSYNIGHTMLRWVYTDKLDSKLGDAFLLDLMKVAKTYALSDLFVRCENILISRLDVRNSVKIYQSADEIGSTKLRESSSALIKTRWNDFTSEDFASMSAQLLYKMLRSKDDYPLHAAIRLKREDVVFLYLIDNSNSLAEKLNAVDVRGYLPLSLALSTDQASIAQTLVSHNADVNASDSQQRTLLYRAVEEADVSACRFLISHGANCSFVQSDSGNTMAHALAAVDGVDSQCMQELAELLLASDVLDLNAQDYKGRACLHVALEHNNDVMIRALMNKKKTLPNSINLNITDCNDDTALGIALTRGPLDEGVAYELVTAGADVNKKKTDTGHTLLHSNIDVVPNVLFLIEHGADVNAVANNGVTPLHLACSHGVDALIEPLLRSAADCNHVTSSTVDEHDPFASGAQTPMHMAIQAGHEQTAALLVKHAAASSIKIDLNIVDTNDETPLSLALSAGYMQLCETLIESGANANHQSAGDGHTLLLRFIKEQNEEAAMFLIKTGASLAQR